MCIYLHCIVYLLLSFHVWLLFLTCFCLALVAGIRTPSLNSMNPGHNTSPQAAGFGESQLVSFLRGFRREPGGPFGAWHVGSFGSAFRGKDFRGERCEKNCGPRKKSRNRHLYIYIYMCVCVSSLFVGFGALKMGRRLSFWFLFQSAQKQLKSRRPM